MAASGAVRWRRRVRRLAPGGVLFATLASLVVATTQVAPAAAAVPTGFTEQIVWSALNQPTAIEFAPDGRVFVTEKRGTIQMFDSVTDTSPTQIADLRTEVDNFWDRGLLGLAIDPQFPARPYLYVSYTYDAPIGGTAPTWGQPGGDSDPCPNPPGANTDGCVVSGKLSRLTLTGNTTTKVDLINDWCAQFPSHTIGDLAFGPDGALYVSGGDGASFDFVDWGQAGTPKNPCGDPPGGTGASLTPPTAEGGALRSQDIRTTGDPVGLDGTILRISPDTVAGLPDNPFASSSDANARRIAAYGVRNPFRMAFRPGTSELWFGDVGWSSFEELDRLVSPTAGTNFGWPCYEGMNAQGSYANTGLNLCQSLYAQGGDTKPYFTYQHGQPLGANDNCVVQGGSSVSGVAWNDDNGPYPDAYDGALYLADYSRGCIWVMPRGANGLPDAAAVRGFVTGASGPVDLTIGPDGQLYWADLSGGTIRRVAYTAGNTGGGTTPTCAAGTFATEYFNNLSFTGTPAATACESAPISHEWGGGAPAAGVQADGFSARWTGTMSFPTAGTYTFTAVTDDGMRVFVDDAVLIDQWHDQNATFTADRVLTAGTHKVVVEYYENLGGATAKVSWALSGSTGGANAPPVPTITSPGVGTTWKVGDTITFTGAATDAEDGALPATALSWDMVLQHCSTVGCHSHPLQSWTGVAGASISAPDHEYPSYLELRLTARDSQGVTATSTLRLDPQTVPITVATSPPGLQVSLGSQSGPSPLTASVIVGGSTSIAAPSPQNLAGGAYTFDSWSDRGAPSHNITAGTVPLTYTATFTPSGSAGCTAGQFVAEYFTNATLTGTPTLTQCESAPLDHDFGAGSPAASIPVDNFSARWSGSFAFATAGDYRFSVTADDGVRVSVDGVRIIDEWRGQAATTFTATRTLTAGAHTVVVEWYDAGGQAVAKASWGLATPPPPPTLTCPAGQYVAEYFTGIALAGTPVVAQCEAAPLDHDWGLAAPAPGVPVDGFSTRWTGTFAFAAAGTYTFSSTTDDGMRVYVDDTILIDQWHDQGATTYTATRALAAGPHKVVVEYYDSAVSAVAKVAWSLSSAPPPTNTAPVPVIATPLAGAQWAVGDPIAFTGSATDAEDGILPASAMSWEMILQRCTPTCVPESLGTWNGVAGATVAAPSVQYPSYLELRLTARDSAGTTTLVTRRLDPRTVALSLASSPAGLQLTAGAASGVTPFTATVIAGSAVTVTAPSPQSLGGFAYSFGAWSDAGAATHTVTAPATSATLTAQYAVSACPTGQYLAEYFGNITLAGAPLLSRCEAAPLNHDFGAGSPAANVPVDNFSGRWTGAFDVTTAGTYLFTAAADDGVRVSVDGVRVIDEWRGQSVTTFTATRTLTAGTHAVVVEWYDSGGAAVVTTSWAVTAPPPPPPTSCPTGQYVAEYFANIALTGTAALVQCETAPLDHDWANAAAAPGLPADNFGARWTGSFDFAAAGNYTFTATADDGVRVSVDGVRIIDEWRGQAATTFTATRAITAGTHTVVVEWYDSGGAAVAKVSWASNGPPPPPPTSCPTGQYVAEYFANIALTGTAALVQCETAPLDHDWANAAAAPGLPADNFGARWTGSFDFATAGNYTFTATADDGVRVSVDGVRVIDEWRGQAATTFTATRAITAGTHTVVVEWYDSGGAAVAKVSWAPAVAPPPPTTTCPAGQYVAEYFANKTLTGPATVAQCETAPLDHDWGLGAPVAGVPADGFSVRWTGSFTFASAGTYTFSATADDGIRVYVDGVVLIDQWHDQGATTYTGTRDLAAGVHTVTVEYYENLISALARVSWTAPVAALAIDVVTANSVLSVEPPLAATFVAAPATSILRRRRR